MSEECKMSEVIEKMSEAIEKITGVNVDKGLDELIDATADFSESVEKFTQRMEKIDRRLKALLGVSIIIDVTFAGDPKISVVGGSNIPKRLDDLKAEVLKIRKEREEKKHDNA